ncbi:MAG: hypothetical protein QOJ66_3635 [Ilumatobacteraceae bacterium]|jgi:hypothetical protein|nr:hypothetical protein [Actinomycetota bacterium]
MNFFTHKLAVVISGAVAMVSVLGITAAPASAAVPYPAISLVSQTNNTAPYVTFAIGETRCITNHYLQLDPLLGNYYEASPLVADADAPWVYAKNLTAGVDYGYVASRARLVDRTTNQIVSYGQFSPWTLASDSTPFHAARTTFSNLNGSHVYATQQEIWWYNANGTTTKLVFQLQQYRQITLYNNSQTSNTIQSSCVHS